jgi:acyl phosphate:glycerol-3-phosphate acyltransferase
VVTAVTVLIVAYLLGAIPFALIVTRWKAGIDVRRVGSGNPGAANVWRTTGPVLGVAVLALDCAKGAAAVMIARGVGLEREWQAMAGLAAVVGHVWPVWLRFRGGKGVAAAAGAFAVIVPAAFGVAVAVFMICIAVTRYVSLGSILAAMAMTLAAYAFHEPASIVAATGAVAILIIARHRENIRRLWRGTELRIYGADVRGAHVVADTDKETE